MMNTNRSGYKGVFLEKDSGKWIAYICHNYKQIYLGRFNTIEEAAEARRKASLVYHKEFATDGR